jgi:hypothetical protein
VHVNAASDLCRRDNDIIDISNIFGVALVLGKVFLDPTIFSAPFNLLYFFSIGALEGTPTSVIQEKVARDFVPLMLANWKVVSRAVHCGDARCGSPSVPATDLPPSAH